MSRRVQRFHCAATVRGLSLIELLVSMFLGLLLSGGVVSAYLGAKRNSFYEEQTARMQENGRYALRLLSRELAMSGFFGGVPALPGIAPVPVGTDCSDRDWALDGNRLLELVNDHTGQSPPVSLGAIPFTCLDGTTIVPDTDLIAIKRTAAEASLRRGVPAAGLTSSTVERWFLRQNSGEHAAWEKLRPLDLLDAARAVPSLSYWEAVTRIYFVRPYSDFHSDGIPSLCIETLAGNGMTSRCLVEGVENLQFEVGIDTDGDGAPNQYTSAPAGSDMQYAVAVKIHLLLRSIDALTGHLDNKIYELGQKVLPARHDGYLRRVLSSTVVLRNRVEPAA